MSDLLTPEGEKYIKGEEGLRLKAYLCPAGRWTIGWGHTSDSRFPVRKGMTIDMDTAQRMFDHDIAEAAAALDKMVKVPLNRNQRAALISFIFNVGEGNFRTSTLLKRLNAGRFDEVTYQLSRWDKATKNGRKVTLPGLAKRRASEAALFHTPDVSVPQRPAREIAGKGQVQETQGKPLYRSKSFWTTIGIGATTIAEPLLSTVRSIKDTVGDDALTIALTGAVLLGLAYLVYGRYVASREEGM